MVTEVCGEQVIGVCVVDADLVFDDTVRDIFTLTATSNCNNTLMAHVCWFLW